MLLTEIQPAFVFIDQELFVARHISKCRKIKQTGCLFKKSLTCRPNLLYRRRTLRHSLLQYNPPNIHPANEGSVQHKTSSLALRTRRSLVVGRSHFHS